MKKKILKILFLFFFLYCTVMLLLTSFLYEQGFRYSKPITPEEVKAKFSAYPLLARKRYEITSKDKIPLVGYLYTLKATQITSKGTIVLSHGLGMTHSDYLHEIEYFVKNGYQVFGFDNTGSGESGGNSVKGLSRSVIDLDYVLTFLENSADFQNTPLFLYGHSWGGFAVCAVNNTPHNVSGIAERSGFNKAVGIMYEKISDTVGKKTASILAPFLHIYEWIKFGKYSIYSAVDGINQANCPALLMHSYEDPIVPFGQSIVGNKVQITNPEVITKEYTNKSHYITSLVENGQVLGTDTTILKMIIDFYDSVAKKKSASS
ncbi:MAG: alpha/beta fold hydrolase [Clostridia bacterium]|nr:alpha/beta fold hydrolase [Clostridia bacterium]